MIPEIRKQKHVGTITGCTYVDKSHNAVASTNEGCILVFGNTLYMQKFEESENRNEKIFVKTIKVTSAVINCIASIDELERFIAKTVNYSSNIFRLIVTGDSDGNIRFYDKAIKLLYWSQCSVLPPICSISFDIKPRFYEIRDPTDFTGDKKTY